MSYATLSDLTDRFGGDEIAQLTDRVNGAMIDSAIVDRALGDADAEIDGYLASRYALPLSSVPPLVVRLACDVARYRLWADRASDAVRTRYEDAVRDLKAIAAGTVRLDGASAPVATATPVGLVEMSSGRDRVFGGGLQ